MVNPQNQQRNDANAATDEHLRQPQPREIRAISN